MTVTQDQPARERILETAQRLFYRYGFRAVGIDTIIADIAKATNSFIDVVVVTHEHQDHVNGFLARRRQASVSTPCTSTRSVCTFRSSSW